MKAAWYERQGPPARVLVVGEMTTPEPGAGEVRIRVAASGINPGDVKKRQDAFVVHDWGSALGFDWVMRHESRVRGLAFMEAILGPVPSWEQFPPQGREIFQKLRTPGVGETMVLDHNMFVEQLLPGSVVRSLSPAEMQHYRAPFVERAARKPMLAWPREIPIAGEPADVVAVVSRYRDALCQSQLAKLLFTVEPGMLVPAPLVAWCRASLPKLEVIALGRGLHFVQEDHPHAIGEHLAAWVRHTRAG